MILKHEDWQTTNLSTVPRHQILLDGNIFSKDDAEVIW